MVKERETTLIEPPQVAPSLAEARRTCARLARTHYENFTIVSRLVPRNMRPHIRALYGFCRTVDDIGDEAPGDRTGLLDKFEGELRSAFDGTPRHPVIVALKETIHQFDLPPEPFLKLIKANRIDQHKSRYRTFEELLHYCDHSANPVGRLWLMLFGYRDEERASLSDNICTALQLTNFWQDISRDLQKGRIYLPVVDMTRFNVSERDIAAGTATPACKNLVRAQVGRTRDLFAAGLPLIDRVHGHLRVDIALFARGGLAVLDRIERADYDTLSRRPTISTPVKLRLLFAALLSTRWAQWSNT
jgi:squalene synthase HpnC